MSSACCPVLQYGRTKLQEEFKVALVPMDESTRSSCGSLQLVDILLSLPFIAIIPL